MDMQGKIKQQKKTGWAADLGIDTFERSPGLQRGSRGVVSRGVPREHEAPSCLLSSLACGSMPSLPGLARLSFELQVSDSPFESSPPASSPSR